MKPEDVSQEAWDMAGQYTAQWAAGPATIRMTVARAITAAVAAEREAWLDAANAYMTKQYGISALGNPIDRDRVAAIRASSVPC